MKGCPLKWTIGVGSGEMEVIFPMAAPQSVGFFLARKVLITVQSFGCCSPQHQGCVYDIPHNQQQFGSGHRQGS